MCKVSRILPTVLAAVLFVAPGAFAHALKGTMTVRTNHQSGVFGFGPLQNKNATTLTGGTFDVSVINLIDSKGYADDLSLSWSNGDHSVSVFLAPFDVNADLTTGSFCVLSSSSLVN